MPSELVFLTYDLLFSRVPPVKLIDNPSSHGLPSNLTNDYITECKKFFQEYRPSENDNLALIDLLIDPPVYETIKLLRQAIVTRNDLEKLKKKGVDDVDYVLKKLWSSRLIQVFQDVSGNEYFALLSDFFVQQYFPEYILNTVKEEYTSKSKSSQVLIEYMNVLEDTFMARKESEKKTKQESG